MSHTSASSTHDGLEQACMTVLASHLNVSIAEEREISPEAPVLKLVDAVLHSELPIKDRNPIELIVILQQKKESITPELNQILSRCLAYVLLRSNSQAAEETALFFLRDTSRFAKNTESEDSGCRPPKEGQYWGSLNRLARDTPEWRSKDRTEISQHRRELDLLQHMLNDALHGLFVDERKGLRLRVLAGKCLAEAVLETQFDLPAPISNEATFTGVAPMLSFGTDVVLRFFASLIVQILAVNDIVVWPLDNTKHRSMFFKHLYDNTEDPVRSFYSYSNEVDKPGMNNVNVTAPTCYLLHSININDTITARGSALAVFRGTYLIFVCSVEHRSKKSFEYVEVPLEFVQRPTYTEDQGIRLQFKKESLIFINAKGHHLDGGRIELYSDNDLTALHSEIENVYKKLKSLKFGPVVRRSSSLAVSLDTAEELGRQHDKYIQTKAPVHGDNAIQVPESPGPNERIDCTMTQGNLEIEDSVSGVVSNEPLSEPTESRGVPLCSLTGTGSQLEQAMSGQNIHSKSAGSVQARGTDTQESLIFPLRRTGKKVYSAVSKAVLHQCENPRLSDVTDKGSLKYIELASTSLANNIMKRKRGISLSHLPSPKSKKISENSDPTIGFHEANVELVQGDSRESLKGRGRLIGQKLAAAFQKADISQGTERDNQGTEEADTPGSQMGSIGEGEDEHSLIRESLGQENLDEIKRGTFAASGLPPVDTQKDTVQVPERPKITPKTSIVDTNGSPRLVTWTKHDNIVSSKNQPRIGQNQGSDIEQNQTSSDQDESGYDAGTENSEGGSDGENISYLPASGQKHGTFSSRESPRINSEMDPALTKRFPRPAGGSYSTHSDPQQSATHKATLRRTPGLGKNSSKGNERQKTPGHPSRELSAGYKSAGLTDSKVPIDEAPGDVRQARPVLNNTMQLLTQANENLIQQLKKEKDAANKLFGMCCEEYSRALDGLLKTQEERVRQFEELINSISQQHVRMCEGLIHRLRENEQRVRLRASLYRTHDSERQG
ncbi:uncharacterized protein ATNIH1004_010425 [Aspergillus tanneri]|uniref:Uncharacterized protein n=1 Tax=Aspergillus tanneri TaxID=1220188 RepID=A0A5M9MD43_9EURO|nr:uncharacterized protein ATNIH1004_010425 [Aspergillus tanneri]KAA8643656.1 hypothetical protein ATNIH1004_010425 [Aspergillus tanneri]